MRTVRNLAGSSFNPLVAKYWRSKNPEKKPDGILINGVNDRSAQSIYLEIKKLVAEGKLQF